MATKSPRPSRKAHRGRALGAPIDPGILSRARVLASRYRLIIEPRPGIGFLGYSLELRGALADGRTPAACARAVIEAQTGMIAVILEAGETPPAPPGPPAFNQHADAPARLGRSRPRR